MLIRRSEAGSSCAVTLSMMLATYPGATALTRMPWTAHSAASVRTSWLMPPLLAAYGVSVGIPTWPAIDEVIVTEPGCWCAIQCRAAA